MTKNSWIKIEKEKSEKNMLQIKMPSTKLKCNGHWMRNSKDPSCRLIVS